VSKPGSPASNRAQWRPPILQALLYGAVLPCRPDHLAEPRGGYFGWEFKKAEGLDISWVEARLSGLNGNDAEVIKWIRLSDGRRPEITTHLSRCDVAPEEAGLQLGYGGRSKRGFPVSTSGIGTDGSTSPRSSPPSSNGVGGVRLVDHFDCATARFG
jgi:hypothetical protein